MVNIIARGIQHALLVPERHRSKTQRDCVGVQWLVGSWHPRRARLGLIEAGGGLPLTASALCTHPRRARLGLIEADAFVSRPMPARRIRGARASASLKRRCRLRGLRPPLCIRGARASASLKRRSFHAVLFCRDRIRGARASASLKLWSTRCYL